MRVAVLVGLAEEAALVRRAARSWKGPPPQVVIGGGTAEAVSRRLPDVFRLPPDLVLSVGYCGALSPDLRSGDLVIPDAIRGPAGRSFACDAAAARLREAAAGLGLSASSGAVTGAAAAIATPGDKRRLAAETGAVAVDLESAVLAAAAAERGIPMAAIRAVLDDAATGLPPLALAAVDTETGKPRLGRLLAGLALSPGQLPALLRLARASAAAKGSLRRLLVRPLPL